MGQIPSTGDLLAEPQDEVLVENISRPDRRIALGRTSDTTLDYRASAAVEESKRRLSAAVRHRERAYLARAWSMLAGGVAALLAGPLLVAGCVLCWSIAGGASSHRLMDFDRHVGNVRSPSAAVLAGASLRPRRAGVRPRRRQRRDHDPDLLLWGPRRIAAARERLSETVSANVVTEAIATINYLRHFDHGVGTDELPTIQPLPVVRYLVSRGWVEVSDCGDQICLLGDARRALGL